MVNERQPSRLRPVNRLGGGWLAAFAVALMMAGAVMAQGGMSKSTERLFDAVFKNDMAAVKASIPAGAKLDAVNSWGQTPADLAVDLGYFEIAHFLTSLRQFEKREKQETPPPSASGFLDPQLTPPTAEVFMSPPAPAQVPEPAPPPLPGGAFDPSIASQGSVLPVIGDIRGPEGTAAPLPETLAPAPSPIPAAEVAARPKGVPRAATEPALPQPPAPPVAAAQPAAPASPVEPMAPVPAEEESGFISNLWGQLADAFSDGPEEVADTPEPAEPAPVAEPVAAAPEDEGPGFISNMLGLLKDSISPPESESTEVPVVAFGEAKTEPNKEETPGVGATEDEEPGFISNMLGQLKDSISAPEAETAEEPVVAFGQAKPAPAQEQLPDEGAAKAPVQSPVQPAQSPSPGDGAPEVEKSGIISDMLESIKADNDSEAAEEPVVAFGQAKPAPAQEQLPDEAAAKAPGPAVAAAEPAKKTPESKPKFYERLSKFLSLDKEPPPRVKRRKRTRATTETAMIRFPVPKRPSEFLNGVALNLSGVPDLNKPAPATESCISKNRGTVLFCIETVAWPDTLLPHFQVSTFMYSGAKSIVRYDDGKATFVHALFPSVSFEAVLDHFERRFGPPTDQQELWLSSLSSPVRSNPMAAWWSIEGSSVSSLQVRKYDDTRGGFPDMDYGAVSLHVQGAEPIFPLLSTANLMLLKFKRSP